MRWVTLAFLLLLLSSCSRPLPVGELDDVTDLAAYLDGDASVLYVRPVLTEAVMGKLGAEKISEGRYTARIKGDSVTFRMIATEVPYVYARELHELPLTAALRWKVYFNARCGQKHAGFTSPCIGTFGPHRAFGQSMIWRVEDWMSCTKGDSLCIEKYKPVGTITYYPDPNCQDTTFVTRNIMEFRCD